MPPSKRKTANKSNIGNAQHVKAARARMEPSSASGDAAEHLSAAARTQFDAVPSTEAPFDVADHGEITAITTRLSGALIGKSLRLNNSAWPGYDDGLTSAVVVDAVALDLPWPSGPAPALIVRTVEDGFRYAFQPDQIWLRLGRSAVLQAKQELEVLQLRAQLERGFSTPRPELQPPDIPTTHSTLDPELRRLKKLIWLSERAGQLWDGPTEELDAAYQAAKETMRDRTGRDQTGRARPDDDDELRNERRRRPRHLNAARNAEKLFSFDAAAHERAAKVSVGSMGQCDCNDTGCGCATRYKCTHCGALLFRGEARTAPVVGKFGTNWQGGKFCCSQGQVDVRQIERDETVEKLWEEHRKRMTTHARQLNNALALASTPVKTPTPPGGSWNPSVVIQGKLHHKVGPLAVGDGETPRYAQLYVHDPAAESDTLLAQRYAAMLMPKKTSKSEAARLKALLNELHNALNDCNSYGECGYPCTLIMSMATPARPLTSWPVGSLAPVQDFVTVGEIFQQEDTVNAQFVINPDKAPASADNRVYSSNFGRRTFNEVCVLCDEQPAKRSVMLRFREGGLYETDESSRAYDPLHFVLLFPCGDDGWHPYMPRSLAEIPGTFELFS